MYPDGTLEKVLFLTKGDVPSHGIGIIIASEVGENSFGNSIPTPKSRSTKNPHNEGAPCPPADGGARSAAARPCKHFRMSIGGRPWPCEKREASIEIE